MNCTWQANSSSTRSIAARVARAAAAERGRKCREKGLAVEQLGRISRADDRAALGQVEMYAEIERLCGIVQPRRRAADFKLAFAPPRFQLPPSIRRPRRVGGIAQERRARQQALFEASQNAVGHGRVHAEVVGVENDAVARRRS